MVAGYVPVWRFEKPAGVRLGGEQRLDSAAEVGILAARPVEVLRPLVWVGLFDGGQIHFFDS